MKTEELDVNEVSAALGVTPKTVYEWLRGKGPLHPDHAKAELLQKLNEVTSGRIRARERLLNPIESSFRTLFDTLLPETARDRLTNMPQEYRDRYQTRVKEVILWVRREMGEFLGSLEAEYGSQGGKKRKPRPNG